MEQVAEKKALNLPKLVAQISGGLLFAAQIVLAFLFLLGVGSSFAGEVSVGTFVSQILGVLDVDFNWGFALVFDFLLRALTNIFFAIGYLVMLIATVINAISSIKPFKQALFGETKEENWAAVGELKNKLGKNTARIITFSIMSLMVVYSPMSAKASAGIWIGLIVYVLAYVAEILFKDEKMPNWPYIAMKCAKLVLKAVILLLFVSIFDGKYIAEAVNSFSFSLGGAVSGGLDIEGTMFMGYMYSFAANLFLMALVSTWLEVVKHHLNGKKDKAEGMWNRYLVSAIVFAVLDFAVNAFLVNTYGEVELTQKIGLWLGGAVDTYIALIVLIVAGMLSKMFPEVEKDTVWFAKKETATESVAEEAALPVEEIAASEEASETETSEEAPVEASAEEAVEEEASEESAEA